LKPLVEVEKYQEKEESVTREEIIMFKCVFLPLELYQRISETASSIYVYNIKEHVN
jgi:hypothetical protein